MGFRWSESYKNLLALKRGMDQRAKDPGAKVYDFRMLDLVMDRSAPTNSLYDKVGFFFQNQFLKTKNGHF